jgi:hypothetical protein
MNNICYNDSTLIINIPEVRRYFQSFVLNECSLTLSHLLNDNFIWKLFSFISPEVGSSTFCRTANNKFRAKRNNSLNLHLKICLLFSLFSVVLFLELFFLSPYIYILG